MTLLKIFARLISIFILTVLLVATALAQNPVWFRVNLKMQARLGNVLPSSDTIAVKCFVNGMSDARLRDGLIADSIFEGIVSFPDSLIGSQINYKFSFRHKGVEVQEPAAVRSFTLLSGGQILPLVWFNDDTIGLKTAKVFFSADMAAYIRNGQFDENTDTLVVRGSFNSWYGNTLQMKATALEPLRYQGSADVHMGLGILLEYKYVIVRPGKEDIWEPGLNRTAKFDGADTIFLETVRPVFLNTDSTTRANSVKFIVDMRPAYRKLDARGMLLDVWQRDTVRNIATVHIIGSQPTFNGWQWNDVDDKWRLYDDGTHDDFKANDSIFTLTVNFPANTQKGAEYKYSINKQDNEAGFAKNHILDIDESQTNQTIKSLFGDQDTLYARYGGLVFVQSVPGRSGVHSYRLEQNYPNPFNPVTEIRWEMVSSGRVVLRIYDVLGRTIVTLVDEYRTAGTYSMEFDGSRCASGTYFYRLDILPMRSSQESGHLKSFAQTKRMVILK